MTTYYKYFKFPDGTVCNTAIQELPSTTIIPFDLENTDYQAYLAWLAEGNTPEPADS
jgi:hypothetical protein